MPYFKTSIKGVVVDKKVSKKGKSFICVYDGNVMHNVFTRNTEYEKGDEVEIDCSVFSERVYIREL